MPSVVGDLLEPLRPIGAALGQCGDCRVFDVNLHSVSIELNFVNSAFAARHLGDCGRQRGRDEAGVAGLDGAGWRFWPGERQGSHQTHRKW
jgi:hypothetical protein